MRTTLIILLAVVVAVAGTVAGSWYGRGASSESAARLQQEKDALAQASARAAEELAAREADLERVREENDSLKSELAAVERELAKVSASVTPVDEFAGAPVETAEEPQAAVAEEPETDRRDRRDRRGPGGEELTPEEMEARRAEWAARREEFATRMRDNVSEFFTNQMAQADDTASQERIKSMEEYSTYMMELFQQMRATEDEEEQAALREEMDAARDTMRTLVTAQQDDMLRDLANEMGVQSGTRQDEFVTRMRDTMESPFFRSPENVMGGGGRRGGWGGGFGRGGEGGPGGGQGQASPTQ
jgi:hypothetical protein